MERRFAPGCALVLYKPQLAEQLQELLSRHFGPLEKLASCCRHRPQLPAGSQVINTCSGCDRRFREGGPDYTTVSLWELLVDHNLFPLPNYGGRRMTIIDACPTRHRGEVHDAVRTLLARMEIEVVEPQETRSQGSCCGDSYWGTLPTPEVVRKMEEKAASLPEEEVVVYCVSCIKAVATGGKQPRYLLDLLFGEATLPGNSAPDSWHAELEAFVAAHP